MDLDPVLLSRPQFAWVIGWHILLPAFTVGMASYIAILEGMHRPLLPQGLDRHRLQPVLSLPPDPHCYRLLRHDGFRGRGGRRLADPQGTIRRRRPRHVVDDALAAHRPGSPADIPRRPARTQHHRASAGEGRRDRGALGGPAVLSAYAVRHS